MSLPSSITITFDAVTNDFSWFVRGHYHGSRPTYDTALAMAHAYWETIQRRNPTIAASLLAPEPVHESPDLTGDPLTPFGVDAGPTPEPISPAAVRAAFVLFCRHFDHTPAVLERAERALQIADDLVVVLPQGEVRINGESGTYLVSSHACQCRDFWVREGHHGGMCKHMIRRELMRLAQEVERAGQVATLDLSAAHTVLAPTDLHRLKLAFGRVRKALHTAPEAAITVANRLLVIHVNGKVITRLTGMDGDGVSHALLAPAAVEAAYRALQQAHQLPDPPAMGVFLDAGHLTLLQQQVAFTTMSQEA